MEMPVFLNEKDGKITFIDPRFDLSQTKESTLFGLVIIKAWKKNPDLAMVLHGFRCQGTKLTLEKGSIKLLPIIGANGWESEEDYNSNRKYLLPFTKIIISIFSELRGYINGKTSVAS